MVTVEKTHAPTAVVDAEPQQQTTPELISASQELGAEPAALHRLKAGQHELYDEVNTIVSELTNTDSRCLVFADFNDQQGGFSLRRDVDGEIWIKAQGRESVSIMDVLYTKEITTTAGEQALHSNHPLHQTVAEHAFARRELYDLVRADITFSSANGEKTVIPNISISQDAYLDDAPMHISFLDTGPVVDLSEPGLLIDSITVERMKVLNVSSHSEETALKYETYQRAVSPAENPEQYKNIVLEITDEPLDDPGNRRGLHEQIITGISNEGKLELKKFKSNDKPRALNLEHFKVVAVALADVHTKLPPLLGSRQEAGKLYQEGGNRGDVLEHQNPSERSEFLEQNYFKGLPIEVTLEREIHRRVPGGRRGETKVETEVLSISGQYEGTATTEQRPKERNLVLVTESGSRVFVPTNSLIRVTPQAIQEDDKVLWSEKK